MRRTLRMATIHNRPTLICERARSPQYYYRLTADCGNSALILNPHRNRSLQLARCRSRPSRAKGRHNYRFESSDFCKVRLCASLSPTALGCPQAKYDGLRFKFRRDANGYADGRNSLTIRGERDHLRPMRVADACQKSIKPAERSRDIFTSTNSHRRRERIAPAVQILWHRASGTDEVKPLPSRT